jgi:chromosome segregation ATPase
MQPPRAFIYNAQKLRRIGAEPPTPDQLASLGFAQPEAGPPKELVAVDSTTHSGARALTANEQTLLDIITHPLYLASQEENALLSEQLKQAQNSEAHERSLAVESRKECTAKTKELEYLKAELLVKTKEYNQHKERQARALEEKISELGWAQKATSDAIAEAEITKNECAAKVKAAESKEKATKQKNEALELELGMRTESLLQTEGQIERYENQIAELKAKFEESESDRATLQVEITRVRAFRTDKEVEAHQRAVRDQLAAERKLEADQLRAEIKELKEKNEEAERARKADTTLLQNYAAENHDLKERIAELKG